MLYYNDTMIGGSKSVARARAGKGKRNTKSLKFSPARPRSGQRRVGKKEGVLGEGFFARPPQFLASSCPPPAAAG